MSDTATKLADLDARPDVVSIDWAKEAIREAIENGKARRHVRVIHEVVGPPFIVRVLPAGTFTPFISELAACFPRSVARADGFVVLRSKHTAAEVIAAWASVAQRHGWTLDSLTATEARLSREAA